MAIFKKFDNSTLIKGQNIIGLQFGYLIPLSRNEDGTYECICINDSNIISRIKRKQLISGKKLSCGCRVPQNNKDKKLEISAGKTYGDLTIMGEGEGTPRPKGRTRRVMIAKCACGLIKTYQLDNLQAGNTTSCGECDIKKERSRHANTTHGCSKDPAYKRVMHEQRRCHNPKDKSFYKYGAKGIKVADEWRGPDGVKRMIEYIRIEFPNYKELFDLGMVIDRTNNSGDYAPGNIRIITQKQNNNNRSVTILVNFFGEIVPLTEICERLGIAPRTVHGRLKSGWHIEVALLTPPHCGRRPKMFNFPISGKVFLLNRENPNHIINLEGEN